jgi:hypothetical protein
MAGREGGERESGQLHGFHFLTTDGSVLNKTTFYYLSLQNDYDSLKCDSIPGFFKFILTKKSAWKGKLK